MSASIGLPSRSVKVTGVSMKRSWVEVCTRVLGLPPHRTSPPPKASEDPVPPLASKVRTVAVGAIEAQPELMPVANQSMA